VAANHPRIVCDVGHGAAAGRSPFSGVIVDQRFRWARRVAALGRR
jgi:hypothetical protein